MNRPSIARQMAAGGRLRLPEYLAKCQTIEAMGWTERQYNEENSIHFLEGELSVYLEAKARATAQPKPAGKGGGQSRTPRRRR